MNKKFSILLVFLANISYFCLAQQPGDKKTNKADAIQIAYLTKELELSSDEAQRFWPIFNNYKEEIRKARVEFETDEVAFEEEVVTIRKKFKPEFKKVLGSDPRVNKVFIADKNFREILRKELQQRRQQRQSLMNRKA